MKYKVNNLKDFIKPPKEAPKNFACKQKINELIWGEKERKLVFRPMVFEILHIEGLYDSILQPSKNPLGCF